MRQTIPVILIGIACAIIDQISKYYVVNHTDLSVFYNEGIAFSLPLTGILQLIFTFLVLIALLTWVHYEKPKGIMTLAFGFVFGGGIGNLIDRLFLGKVVDFIDVGFWPIFNIADSFVTVGAIMLIWSVMLTSK